MDQGFTSQGLAAPRGRATAPAAKASARAVHAPEDGSISMLQGVSSAGSLAFFGSWMGAPIGNFLGNFTARWPRVSTVIKSVFVAPFSALQKTELKSSQHFLANYFSEIHAIAKGAGADGIAARAAKAAEAHSARAVKLGARAKAMADPAGKKIIGALNGMNGTAVDKGIMGFMGWRAGRLEAASAKALGQAEQSFVSKIKGFLGKAIAPEGAMESLGGAHKSVLKLHQVPAGAKRVAAIKKASGVIEKTMEAAGESASKGLVARSGKISGFLGQAAGKLEAALGYRTAISAANGSTSALSGLVTTAAHSIGKMPMLTGVILTGAIAGAGAMLLTGKKQSREAKDALKGLIADIGDEKHPIVLEARKVYKKQGGGRSVSTGLNAATEIGNGVLMTLPGYGGMAGMAGIMALQFGGMGAGMFVPENPVLDAYAALKAEEQGRAKIEPEQKVYYMRALVSLVPGLAKNGGQYNKLAEPIAAAMIERRLNLHDSLQLMANAEQFMTLARDVDAKLQVKEAEAKAKVTAASQPVPKNTATAAYQAAEKPANAKVNAGAGITHDKLETVQKTLGNG